MKTRLVSVSALVLCAAVLAFAGCKKDEPAKSEEAKKAEPGKAEKPAEPEKLPEATQGDEPAKPDAAKMEAIKNKVAEAGVLCDPLPCKPGAADALKPQNALETVDAFDLLPAGVPVVAVAADPLGILERVMGGPYEEFVKKYAGYYEKAVAEVTQETGYNLLSPKTYGEMGLDLHGPFGFALLKLDPVSIVVFAKLTDADKFKNTLYAIAGRVNEKFEPHVVGDAMAICPKNDEEVCFVLKGSYVFLHAVDAGDEKGLAAALEFAGSKPTPSLAASESFKTDVERLTLGRDFAAIANVGALLSQYRDMPKVGWEDQSVERQKKDLEELRKGTDAEVIKMAEEQLAEEEGWARKAKERREKEAKLILEIFAPIKYVGAGAELTDRGLKARMIYEFDPDSKMAKLARPLAGTPALLKALPEKPVYLALMNVDLESYVDLIKTMVAGQGVEWEMVQEEFRKNVGLGLEDDVLAAFSGELGLAFSAPTIGSAGKAQEYLRQVKVWATLGLKDAAKAALVLDKFATLPGVSMFFRKTEAGWQADVPEWKSVFIKTQDGQLVISTEEAFAADLAAGKGESFLGSIGDAELKGLLSTPDSYGIAMVDFGLVGNLFLRALHFDMAWDEPAELMPENPSEEYKKLRQQYEELKTQAKKAREEYEANSDRLAGELLNTLGVTAAVARKEGNLYVCDMMHVMGGETLSKSAATVLDKAIETYELQEKRHKELWPLEDKKWEVKRQLDDLRMKENEAAPPAPDGGIVPPAGDGAAAPGEVKVIEATK
jgi:hypothetical protein